MINKNILPYLHKVKINHKYDLNENYLILFTLALNSNLVIMNSASSPFEDAFPSTCQKLMVNFSALCAQEIY